MNLASPWLSDLDLPGFLALTRVGFVLLGALGAVLLARSPDDRRAGRIVLWVGIVGHFIAWAATMAPLPNVYGANGSQDRENHLGWANVVSLGFSPLHTFQVKHLHFEPLWPLLTAAVSGFNVDRVPWVFQWAPLAIGLALLLVTRGVWIRGLGPGEGIHAEGAFAALGALLLMAVPGDFGGPFRNPWALTMLLKPNHALGLVLVPLAALAFARARDLKTRLLAGFVLQLVGWAFVIHMALFAAGLLVFVVLSWVTGRSDRRKDLVDAGVTVGANLLLVSPYLVMLVVAYPFLDGYGPRVSPWSERPLEAPARMGVLFLLSAFGAAQTYRNRGRPGRILASQWVTAHLVWQAFPLLGIIGQAREQDEAFYWCRFWTGLFAGVGAFHAVRLGLSRLSRGADAEPRVQTSAALSLALLLPALLPSWWDPSLMDQYFAAARKPVPDWIAEPSRFIRTSTPPEGVFAGDREYATWIAAYGARRVLLADSLNQPKDVGRRTEIEAALFGEPTPALITEARERYGVQYILATSAPLAQAPSLTIEMLKSRPHLETVYDRQFAQRRVVIWKLTTAGSGR